MGQGTSKYRKITRTPQTGENAGKKLWYATAVSDREMSFEDFVTHISEHNSPYSRGTIHGVLMDTLDCLKHLILDGKSVRFSDLGLFSIGMTSRGEVSKEKVTAASVQGVHLIVRNTKSWSNAELKKLTKIVAYDDYTTGAEDGGGTENTPGGGGKVHRLILAAEIERTARNAQQRHLSLILPGIGKETAMIERQHQHVGDAETQGEDLSRRKPVQHQHLGGNEGGSPDRHRQEGYQMVEYIVIFRLHILIFPLMVQK